MKCYIHDDWPTSYHRQREDGLYDFVNKHKPACISPDFNDEMAEKAGWQQHTEADARKRCGMVDIAGNPDGRRCWLPNRKHQSSYFKHDGYYRLDNCDLWWVECGCQPIISREYTLASIEVGKSIAEYYNEVTEAVARDWCGMPPFGARAKPPAPPKPYVPLKGKDTLPIKRKDPTPPDEYAPQIFHRKPRCPKCHHKHKGYGKGTYVEKVALFGCVCRGCGAEFWVDQKEPSSIARLAAIGIGIGLIVGFPLYWATFNYGPQLLRL